MPINPLRVKKLSESTYAGGTVIYQMCRDIRAHDNDALLFAQQLAKERGAELIVNYVIWNYTWVGATRRFYDFVVPSLQETETTLRAHAIPLVVTFKEKNETMKNVSSSIGAVVIDQLPLRFMKKWKEDFLKHHTDTPLYEVDAHNCIPVWETSPKQEFAARTIRSKIHAKLPLFLEDHSMLAHHDANTELLKTLPPIDWNNLSKKIICDERVSGIGSYVAGEKAAKRMLSDFLHTRLESYDTNRNNINIEGQSNLSPYITHGIISRRRIILDLLTISKISIEDAFDAVKNGSNGSMGSVAAFIEECVIRSELCDNYCYYNDHYDTVSGFPTWSQETLRKARTDTREYLYSKEEFQSAKTHDNLWNGAQMQMMTTGTMHGYMRMYWAKKILEWTTSPEEALDIAIYLNDTYELDGRDPNGYVGCAWSIGGVHDRPWFGRPVFGTVRFMARSGVEKRGDVNAYIEKWLQGKQSLF